MKAASGRHPKAAFEMSFSEEGCFSYSNRRANIQKYLASLYISAY